MSAEPLWVALRSDWLSVETAAAVCSGKSHLISMRMAAFSSSYDEAIAAPRSYFVRRVVLVGRVSFCYFHPRCCQAIDVDDESGIQVSVATPTTLPRERMQSLRHAPHGLGPPARETNSHSTHSLQCHANSCTFSSHKQSIRFS